MFMSARLRKIVMYFWLLTLCGGLELIWMANQITLFVDFRSLYNFLPLKDSSCVAACIRQVLAPFLAEVWNLWSLSVRPCFWYFRQMKKVVFSFVPVCEISQNLGHIRFIAICSAWNKHVHVINRLNLSNVTVTLGGVKLRATITLQTLLWKPRNMRIEWVMKQTYFTDF